VGFLRSILYGLVCSAHTWKLYSMHAPSHCNWALPTFWRKVLPVPPGYSCTLTREKICSLKCDYCLLKYTVWCPRRWWSS
jgi:hypothetical protein